MNIISKYGALSKQLKSLKNYFQTLVEICKFYMKKFKQKENKQFDPTLEIYGLDQSFCPKFGSHFIFQYIFSFAHFHEKKLLCKGTLTH